MYIFYMLHDVLANVYDSTIMARVYGNRNRNPKICINLFVDRVLVRVLSTYAYDRVATRTTFNTN